MIALPHLLTVEKPLALGNVKLTQCQITEALSVGFSADVTLLSTQALAVNEMLGQSISLCLHHEAGTPRYWHGVIDAMRDIAALERGSFSYRLSMRSWLQYQDRQPNYRIFQNQSVTEISQTVLRAHRFYDYDMKGLHKKYPKREYCLQFNESLCHFLKRIWAESGIFFYYKHEDEKSCLYLADGLHAYQQKNAEALKLCDWQIDHTPLQPHINSAAYNAARIDSNFKAVATVGNTKQSLPIRLEQNYYNTHARTADDLQDQTKRLAEKITLGQQRLSFKSLASDLSPSVCFSIEGESQTHWLVHRIVHTIKDSLSMAHSSDSQSIRRYSNSGQAFLADRVFRPSQLPQVFMPTVQTATVVGKDLARRQADAHGRIKVRFHWDEAEADDDSCSCWIRVLQPWSGNNMGVEWIPAVGEEVWVKYINGDPDQPIVVASAYNSANLPPYSLPESDLVTGVKTHLNASLTQTANELRFNDDAASASLGLFTAGDLIHEVNGEHGLSVGDGYSSRVKADITTELKQGAFSSSAAGMIFKSGNSRIVMNASGIQMKASTIALGQAGSGSAANAQVALHWVQAGLVDSQGNAQPGVPYTVIHIDGSEFTGHTNEAGHTEKISELNPGAVSMEFGERQKILLQLKKERHKLQAVLDQIIAKLKAQAAKDKQLLEKKLWWDRVYIYGKGFAEAAVGSVESVVHGAGKGVVAMFEEAGQALALSGRLLEDASTGDVADLDQLEHTASRKTKMIIQSLQTAYKDMQLLYGDADTKAILENFAADYYHDMDHLMMLKGAASVIGGIAAGIVLALITKNVMALGAGVIAGIGPLVEDSGVILNQILEKLRELKKCVRISDASLDKVHELRLFDLEHPPEPGAEHISQVERLKGFDTDFPLAHPAGDEYNLTPEEAENFHGEPQPVMLKKGMKIYRVVDEGEKTDVNGSYWVHEVPESMESWRSSLAVKQVWNKNGYYVEHILEENMPSWEGASASQSLKNEGFPDWLQPGGGKQIYIPGSRELIPETLLRKATHWEVPHD